MLPGLLSSLFLRLYQWINIRPYLCTDSSVSDRSGQWVISWFLSSGVKEWELTPSSGTSLAFVAMTARPDPNTKQAICLQISRLTPASDPAQNCVQIHSAHLFLKRHREAIFWQTDPNILENSLGCWEQMRRFERLPLVSQVLFKVILLSWIFCVLFIVINNYWIIIFKK